MFSTITSKYPGTCKRCGQGFAAGSRIRYGGRGRTYHLSAECAVKRADSAADRDPGFVDIDRMQEDRDAEITAERF